MAQQNNGVPNSVQPDTKRVVGDVQGAKLKALLNTIQKDK